MLEEIKFHTNEINLRLKMAKEFEKGENEFNKPFLVPNFNNNNAPIIKEQIMAKIKHVYHRKDGRWEYTFVKDKQKIYLIAGTKDKLLEKIKSFKEEKIKLKARPTKETLTTWSLKWLEIYKKGNVKENSYKVYKNLINFHIIPYFKNLPLEMITQEKIQIFINNIKAERTKEYVYMTIKQILKQAFINKKIKSNIAETITKPRRLTRTIKTALTLNEQDLFIKELKNYDVDTQMFMIFSIVLGSRRGETLAFKFEDINKEKNQIHIKGTKTYGADRKIKISDEMIELLERNKTTKNNEFYFKFQVDRYSRQAKEIFRKIKAENKTLHDLRHTCSTNLYYLGVSDKQRQQILGHASILMTNDIYTNLQDDINKDGLLKLYNNLYFKY